MTVLAILIVAGFFLIAVTVVARPLAARRTRRAAALSDPTLITSDLHWPSVAFGAGAAIVVVAGVLIGALSFLRMAPVPNPQDDASAIVPSDGMVEALKQAIDRNPHDLATLLLLARARFTRGETGDAIMTYTQVLQIDPRQAEALAELGLILYQGKLFDMALATVERSLHVDPRHLTALWVKGQILQRKGNDLEAIQTWQHFLTVKPKGTDADLVRQYIRDAQRRLQKRP